MDSLMHSSFKGAMSVVYMTTLIFLMTLKVLWFHSVAESQVNFSLCLMNYKEYVIKTQWGAEVQRHQF
jgi:hypothetical protein